MELFDYQPNQHGKREFVVSQRWWIFVILAAGLLTATLLMAFGTNIWRFFWGVLSAFRKSPKKKADIMR